MNTDRKPVISRYSTQKGKFECSLGPIDNSGADPRLGPIPDIPVIQIDGERLERLLTEGPIERSWGGVSSATTEGDRTFLHIDYDGVRTSWELFEAVAEWRSEGSWYAGTRVAPTVYTPPDDDDDYELRNAVI